MATFSLKTYPPSTTLPPHRHRHAKISVILAGAVRESHSDRARTYLPGTVFVKPALCLHADEISPRGLKMFAIWLDEEDLGGLGFPSEFRAYTVSSRTKLLVTALNTFQANPSAALDACIEVLGSLQSDQNRHSRDLGGWAEAKLREIRRRPDLPWTVHGIAAEVGLHPVYVSRAFRRLLGRPLSEYLSALKLERAAFHATTSSRSFGKISYQLGFADQAHLSREFKRSFACSPSEYRMRFSLFKEFAACECENVDE